MNERLKFENDIIDLLKGENIQIDKLMENTLKLIIFETYATGKEAGIKEGKQIGINKPCQEIENKLNSMKKDL